MSESLEGSMYKVQVYSDNTFEVYTGDYEGDYEYWYRGSLADCLAWIRLREAGRI